MKPLAMIFHFMQTEPNTITAEHTGMAGSVKKLFFKTLKKV